MRASRILVGRTRNAVGKSLLLAVVVAGLPACSSNPLGNEDVQRLIELSPQKRLIYLNIQNDGETFGDRETWLEDLSGWLEELNVATGIRTKGDPANCDMVVTVSINDRDMLEPEIDGQVAFLDFLAYSTIPPLQLWVGDVKVDPGVEIVIGWSLNPDSAETVSKGPPKSVKPIPTITTSLRERTPLLSWYTLGGVFLPPFLFREVDREHLGESAGERVRVEAALMVATVLKTEFNPKGGELLRDLSVELGRDGDLVLTYRTRPDVDVGKIRLWLDTVEGPAFRILRSNSPDARRSVRLQKLLSSRRETPPELLRIEAQTRGGERLRYTLPLPRSEAQPSLIAREVSHGD